MDIITGKISLNNTQFFDAGGFSGQVYVPNDANAGFNALLVTVNGRHPKKKMLDTTRSYFVVEGEGTFAVDDTSYQVTHGDLFVIEAGHTYEYSGNMKLFEFNVSADNSFQDEKLE